VKDIGTLLQMFADTHGLSGYEDSVAALLRQEMDQLVDEVRTDKMGNVIGIRSGDGPAVMVAAHMDEIGLMVSHIDDDGYLRVVSVGGFFDQTILSQRVLVHGRDGKVLRGVVGSRPPHLMDAEERKKMVKLKEMFVDCGATSAANAAELGVEIGSPITQDRHLMPLGNDFVTGKALDNRAGVAMMVAALQRVAGQDCARPRSGCGHCAEGGGPEGARTSAYGLSPDVAIATDVTILGIIRASPGTRRTSSWARGPPSPYLTPPVVASSPPARLSVGCGSRQNRPRSPIS
jgi:endoglucanase